MYRSLAKALSVATGITSLTACGTFSTIGKNNADIARDLRAHRTYCESLPRVYSGISYDVCRLNSNTGNLSGNQVILAFYLMDTVASGVSDTLLLPLSIAQQASLGSVDI